MFHVVNFQPMHINLSDPHGNYLKISEFRFKKNPGDIVQCKAYFELLSMRNK